MFALVDPEGLLLSGSFESDDPPLLREWGSVTKSLTAATVEEAANRGLLDPDEPVRSITPRLPAADYTVRELVEHRSGLLRVPWQMLFRPARDPYRRVSGGVLPERWTRPLGERGQYLYSNTGYAVLGEVLDAVTGNWWNWMRRHVFDARLAGSVTLMPALDRRALRLRADGSARAPWSLSAGPFAAAGGAWSTFDDLVSFARWSARHDDCPSAWERRGGADFINGATRDAHTSIVRSLDSGLIAVVHSLGIGARTDMMAIDLIRRGRL